MIDEGRAFAGAAYRERVEYVGGEQQQWERWWAPVATDLILDDGMGLDPSSLVARYSGAWKQDRLVDLADARCLVLLGEPGSGKSDELSRESSRLADAGVAAIYEDLGRHPDWPTLRRAIFERPGRREAFEDGEVVLFLDGLDEVLQSITRRSRLRW